MRIWLHFVGLRLLSGGGVGDYGVIVVFDSGWTHLIPRIVYSSFFISLFTYRWWQVEEGASYAFP